MNAPAILPSQIHAVTVHADGAVVRRRVALAGVAGRPAALRVVGLPLAAAGRPVRARVRDGGAEVLSCRVAAVTAPPEAGDDRALERAVEAAGAAVATAERRVEAALARLRALGVLDPPARPDGPKGQPPPASPALARFELLRFRDQQAERLSADLAAARQEAEQAGERLAQAEGALQQASATREARAGEMRLGADLLVRWPADGDPGWIELEYVVPGARWAPSYVLRFDRGLERVVVQLRGMVAQRSGEDWTGVRVACATAPLQSWCELPRLPGRRIGRAQAAPPSGWRPAPAGADVLFADWDAFAAAHPAVVPSLRFGAARPKADAYLGGPPGSHADKDYDEEVAVAAEAAAPMPPPMAAPAPIMAASSSMMSMKKAKAEAAPRGAARRMVGAVAGGGAATSDQSERRKERAVSREEASLSESESDDAAPAAEPEAGFAPGADLLDFAALRLAGADGGSRGRPRPEGVFAGDARWVQARREAVRRSAELAPPPPGHQPVAPARFAVRWDGELPVDVPGDGAWHLVPLADGEAAVRLSLVVVPRESRTAFRSASLANPFDRALVAGPADVYVGADFLLTARLPDIAPNAPATVGLGVEQTLAVARNATFAEEAAGLLGGSLHLRHTVRVSLHNKGARPAAVEVRERLPQPDEQVEHCAVKQLKVEPAWEEWHPDDAVLPGGRRWRLTLAAGEQRDLAHEYRVEIPAKNELVGGNRREA